MVLLSPVPNSGWAEWAEVAPVILMTRGDAQLLSPGQALNPLAPKGPPTSTLCHSWVFTLVCTNSAFICLLFSFQSMHLFM